MKGSLDILTRDLKALARNPIALLVVGALLVLPGLYAWYCIVANWDPYANTGSMPVAVVNEDAGAESGLAGKVDVGGQVVEKLADNDGIDWRFYDSEEEALHDTRLAIVYATIVLPEDLSKNLVGIFDGAGERPTVYYYPNEKYNAVATKVTDSAAQTLVRQVNQTFSSTVNEKILSSAQDLTDAVEARVGQANDSAIAEVRSVRQDLDKVVASLDDADSAIAGWRQAAAGATSALGTAGERLPALASGLDEGAAQLDDLRRATDGFEGQLSATILKSSAAISDMSGTAATSLNNATADLKAVKSDLQAVEAAATGSGDAALRDAAAELEVLVVLVEGVVADVDARVAEMNRTVQDMAGTTSDVASRMSADVMPQLDAGAYALATSLSRLSGAVGQFGPSVEGLRGVLAQTDAALADAAASVADAKTLLRVIGDDLGSTAGDIGALGKALEIEKLSDLLGIDPENAGAFVSMPVQMVTEKVNPVSNYGTAVAPFYTNLALWIGCFILVSLMKVEVAGAPGATARQRYFGRWLLFCILSFLQSQVICGVDILLGIDCAHPALFMLAGAVCSFVYMNLIYALVKTFRNIGKTLCIFLLIMQVPGSSGMYPIQMMPGFFQFIHPALPFTYGIDAMRESLCGMYGLAYVSDLLMLLLIVPGSLFIGLALRSVLANTLLLFDEEMNKVGFFASEQYEEGMQRAGLRSMMRALAAHDAYADDIEERAWRFRRTYGRMRKVGNALLFAIPFATLVLMLPVNLLAAPGPDFKLTILVDMLIVVFLIQIALLVLEYTHRSIEEETRLVGESLLGDFGLDALFGGAGENVAATDADAGVDAGADAGGGPAAAGMVPVVAGAVAAGRAAGGPARDIFATDVQLGFRNVVGVVVIVLLVITPSMYAWFNIAGSWDPYGSTGNLKVAVANEDTGYKGDLIPVTINIGDTIVSQLRGNGGFDWQFVADSEQALAGVESSDYYAAIVIPADFSANMLTYLTSDADYPDVVYYTNEKENPIAPIITQKGADSIQESIRVSFTERVDEIVLGVAYDVLEYVKSPDMSSYVVKASAHLDDALADVRRASSQVKSLSSLMRTTSGIVSTLGATLAGLKDAADSAKVAVADAEAGAQDAGAAFDEAVSIARDALDGRSVDFDKVQAVVDVALDLLEAGTSAVPGRIDERIDEFQALVDDPATSAQAREKGRVLIADLKTAREHAVAADAAAASARTETDAVIADTSAELESTRAYFDDALVPSVDALRTSLRGATSAASEIVASLDGVVTGLGGSTDGLSNQLATLSSGLAKAADKLDGSAVKVEGAKKRVADALKSGDLRQIEDVILGSDTESLAASLAVPVHLEREALYPVSNYGSAMAPFYTVLSLWVGALVMISTMRVHVLDERLEELRRRYGAVRPRHVFFGRYGIFGLIGFLQSSLVLLGDVLFLHIQCENPVMFFVLGVFVGQMFCLIVYTITELFGDVGKAICVILLIMQVAASGGTFPVEMYAPILLDVADFLPFTYAMRLLQECVGGIMWADVAVCVVALAVMAGGMLVAGLPLRRPFGKLNRFFEEQLEKTGYM